MTNAIMNVLYEYGLEEKILALIIDNASAIITYGKHLSYEFELEFDNLAFFHYQCAVHVLNFAVSQGIELIDDSIIKV